MKKQQTKIIILCGGFSNRWNNFLGTEKHFVKINGTTLLENTINILSRYNVSINIVVREDIENLYSYLGQKLYSISKDCSLLEYYKIKSTYELWNNNGKTVILMGDVWFTKQALKKIIGSHSTKLLFWGRQRKNYHTKCNHGELFAISFSPNSHDLIKSATLTLENLILYQEIKIAGGWGIYNIISGLTYLMSKEKIIKGKALYSNFNNIIDITDDVDTPKDYNNIEKALNRNHFDYFLQSLKMKSYYLYVSCNNLIYELMVYCNKKFKQ